MPAKAIPIKGFSGKLKINAINKLKRKCFKIPYWA